MVRTSAGNLRHFLLPWRTICSDPFVLEGVQGYRIPFHSTPFQIISPPEPTFSKLGGGGAVLRGEIDRLTGMGAIEACVPSAGQFISSYFLVDKANGKKRFILNLKRLKKFLKPPHFKLEDIRTVMKLLSQGAFMFKIDLKDAYFLIPVHQEDRKFHRVSFQGELFQFTCLPFGLATFPYVFTKVMKPVMGYLRSRGLISSIYLDDILCIASSADECEANARQTIELLSSLGFIVNKEKSSVSPSMRCEYLGFTVDSMSFALEVPQNKREAIQGLLHYLRPGVTCTIRLFSRLIGSLIAICAATAYGMLHTKSLERIKQSRLILNDGDFDCMMLIPCSAQPDLDWWISHIMSSANPIRTGQTRATIFSDASLTGWGAACGGKTTGGLWSAEERRFSINYLELLAIYLALRCFATNLSDCEILLRVDNTTAICYINRMGGTRFPHLNDLTREICQWCEARRHWLFAAYIPSKENIEADYESRVNNIDTEWELAEYAFQRIVDRLGHPQIDLFASRINAKCELYCSWHRDPFASSIRLRLIGLANSSMLFHHLR